MADHCDFCGWHRPADGTNVLVLGGDWLEFCQHCGETEMLTNSDTGEVAPIAEVFERGGNSLPYRTEEFKARFVAARQAVIDELAAEARRKERRRARLKGGRNNPNAVETAHGVLTLS